MNKKLFTKIFELLKIIFYSNLNFLKLLFYFFFIFYLSSTV